MKNLRTNCGGSDVLASSQVQYLISTRYMNEIFPFEVELKLVSESTFVFY